MFPKCWIYDPSYQLRREVRNGAGRPVQNVVTATEEDVSANVYALRLQLDTMKLWS